MRNRVVTGACIGAFMFFSGTGSTIAAYAGPCAAELNAVESAILSAEFTGTKANTDASNLLVKLQAAESKVTLTKFTDAIDKLQDISDTATALANAPKPKLTDAVAINTTVETAIACVGSLAAP